MPDTKITIDRSQRAGLYELIRNHLYGVDDFWIAFSRSRDYATAERLGIEFSEDFRLLADIGWAADDERESFELTMPPHDLMETLRRLRGEAEQVLTESRTEREATEEDERTNKRFRVGRDACEALLASLDPSRERVGMSAPRKQARTAKAKTLRRSRRKTKSK